MDVLVEDVIPWVGFLGAWLLFVGPVYQAALELSERDALREAFGQAMTWRPERVSAWWWLLPPVHYVLQRRRSRDFHRTVLSALRPDQIQVLVTYFNKATGWLFVGLGGLLIATKETSELAESREWGLTPFVVLVVGMAVLSIAIVAARMGRGQQMTRRSTDYRGGGAAAQGPGEANP